jgi:hypothetical protein
MAVREGFGYVESFNGTVAVVIPATERARPGRVVASVAAFGVTVPDGGGGTVVDSKQLAPGFCLLSLWAGAIEYVPGIIGLGGRINVRNGRELARVMVQNNSVCQLDLAEVIARADVRGGNQGEAFVALFNTNGNPGTPDGITVPGRSWQLMLSVMPARDPEATGPALPYTLR